MYCSTSREDNRYTSYRVEHRGHVDVNRACSIRLLPDLQVLKAGLESERCARRSWNGSRTMTMRQGESPLLCWRLWMRGCRSLNVQRVWRHRPLEADAARWSLRRGNDLDLDISSFDARSRKILRSCAGYSSSMPVSSRTEMRSKRKGRTVGGQRNTLLALRSMPCLCGMMRGALNRVHDSIRACWAGRRRRGEPASDRQSYDNDNDSYQPLAST